MSGTEISLPFGEKNLTLTSGELAKQASGSVVVTHGETTLLVTATVSKKPREGADFFPLMVDYEERMYAAGKISGSKFIKRENRPSEEAILKGRLVDRSIRPLFPKSFRREVQVIVTALSYDEQHDPAAPAVIGASAALMQTGTPFNGPIGAVRVGLNDDGFILNPTDSELNESPLDLLVAATKEKVVMIEAAANEISEEKMAEAIKFAKRAVQETLQSQSDLSSEEKEKIEHQEPELYAEIKKEFGESIARAVSETDIKKRSELLDKVETEALEKFGSAQQEAEIIEGVNAVFLKTIRQLISEKGHRPDGRDLDEIRPISIKVSVLPRVHGSALFNRGETQALTVATLAGPGQEQWIDTMEESAKKRYMHHYNFPPYSTGEVRPLRSGRREIGHGALAEKALIPVLPQKEDFPYTIRLVSEILGSNGSTSMAAVCGSTLALMDAGVPIKKPVAGIAMGLVSDDQDESAFKVLTDLQGLEDFAGEMDFKVAGTKDGITAIQLDVKNNGLSDEIIEETFSKARVGRLAILEKMAAVLEKPRPDLSKFAPRIISTNIDPEKIGELIGPGGKTINKIIDAQGGREILSVDIEGDGTVMITSNDSEKALAVKAIVESIGLPIEVGQEFTGEVVAIQKDRNSGKEIGAIVQLTPNRDGMIHISALGENGFVNKVSDVLKIGQPVKVKVKEVDPEKNRISLIRLRSEA